MGLAATLARRSLLSRPGRTLFSVLGIALGVATVVGVIVLDHNTIIGLSQPFRARGAPDLQLRLPGGQEGSTQLYELEGVSLMARYFQQDAIVRREPVSEVVPDDPESREKVRLLAIDAQYAPDLGVYDLAEGAHLAADGRRQVLVGQALAERFDVDVGDTLWIARPKRQSRFVCENGELVPRRTRSDSPVQWDFKVAGLLAREQIGRRSGGMVLLVDFENGVAVFEGGPQIQPMLWASLDRTVDPERLKPTLAEIGSYELNPAAILGQAADERAFRMGVRMAGLLALVLGLYVIFHTLSMSLTERMKEVGTLNALGSTRAQVGRVFLLEAVLLAGAGALLGVAGGIVLAYTLLSAGITTLGTGKDVGLFVVPWGMVLPLAGTGFLVALVGSVYPLVSLRGTSTVAVLRGDEHPVRRRSAQGFQLLYALLLALVVPSLYFVIVPVVGELTPELTSVLIGAVGFLSLVIVLSLVMPALLAGVCAATTRPLTRLWPLAGRLTARAMRAAPARIGVCTSALALVTAGFVGLKGMTGSLEGEVVQWADEAALDKVWVRGMPPTEFEQLARHMEEYPGMVGLEKGGTGVHVPFLVQGVAVAELAGYGPCAEDPALLRALDREQGMIVSRRLAQDQGFEVGDEFVITRADGIGERFTVVAISDAYGHYPSPDERIYGLIADHRIEEYFCQATDTVDEVAVRLAPGTDPDVLRSAIEAFHGGPHRILYRTGAEVLADHRADIRRDFVLFDVLLALTAALAGLGVLNGQLLAALERSKELGVLKALGASRRQLAGMVLLEALAVGLVGGVLGAAAGLGLTRLVVGALRGLVGLDLPHVGPGAWLWAGAGGSVVVALLAAVYPMWRTARADAVRAVRTG
jgi:putative ABC transport system permease protein